MSLLSLFSAHETRQGCILNYNHSVLAGLGFKKFELETARQQERGSRARDA